MIENARVLQDDFLPREIVHRHEEMNRISSALEPIVHDERPENTFMFGPTGAGKTCIAQYSIEKLRETVLDVATSYVNCWLDNSRFKVLYRILDDVGQSWDVHRGSTPKDELLERIRAYDDVPLIVILDEVDQLDDKQLLYDLYSIPHLTLILIANREEEVFSSMPERVVSRLRGSYRIQFAPYEVSELVSILEDRARKALVPGAISDHQFEFIADAAAGDARVAIATLRIAASEARAEDLETIPDGIIEEAVAAARGEIRQKNIETLTDHQRVLYEIIVDAGEIAPGKLYERYGDRVDDPKSVRTLRRYLDKMIHYNLVRAQGENSARTYCAV